MQRKLIVIQLLLFCSYFAVAQQTSTTVSLDDTKTSVEKLTEPEWSFYVDAEHKIYYIDFEQINVNVSHIIVRDQENSELWRESVWDLPVNTIYELDLSNYTPGTYQIEVRTFSEPIRKEVVIAE